MLRMAKMSPAVLLRLRSSANRGIGVIVWPPLHPAALLTSVPAATARTALESAQPKRPTSRARHPNVLPTLRSLGPAASPVVCRLPHPPPVLCLSFDYFFPKLFFNFCQLALFLRDLGLIFVLWLFSRY